MGKEAGQGKALGLSRLKGPAPGRETGCHARPWRYLFVLVPVPGF